MRKKREIKNEIRWTMPSLSVNEGMARAMIAAFCAGALAGLVYKIKYFPEIHNITLRFAT